MSFEAMKPVWESSLSPTDKLVLLAMTDFANKTGGSIFPSVATIVRRTSLGVRTVARSIAHFRTTYISAAGERLHREIEPALEAKGKS